MAALYVLNLGILGYAYYKARQDFWNNPELSGLITRGMKMKIKRQMDKLVSFPIVFLACCILTFYLFFSSDLIYRASLVAFSLLSLPRRLPSLAFHLLLLILVALPLSLLLMVSHLSFSTILCFLSYDLKKDTFAVINRFYNYKNPGSPIFFLAVLNSVMILDGFVTSLVFGMTRSVSRRLWKRLRMLVRRRK